MLSLFSTCSAVSVRQGLRSQRFCISWGNEVSVCPAHGCTAHASGGKGSVLRTSAPHMAVQPSSGKGNVTKWSHLRRAVTETIDKVVVWPAGFLIIHERLCSTFCRSSSHNPARPWQEETVAERGIVPERAPFGIGLIRWRWRWDACDDARWGFEPRAFK